MLNFSGGSFKTYRYFGNEQGKIRKTRLIRVLEHLEEGGGGEAAETEAAAKG